ncbi:MAG: hypothetical protein ACLFRG_00395 [Desulfococcaceae bacterium]
MILLVFSANLFWGGCATYCFYRTWMAFLGLVACAVGLLRRRVHPSVLLRFFYDQTLDMTLHGLGLALLFAFFWTRLSLGRTPPEALAFLLTATTVMLVVMPRIPGQIDQIWETTNLPRQK